MKKRMVNFIFSQKYRYDLGMQLLVFVNFSMMCATMLKVFGIRGYWMFPLIIVAFFAVWCMGYILDKYVRIQRKTEQQAMDRSYQWELFYKLFKDVEEIKKILKETKE